VVAVRHGASASYTAVREHCESSPTILAHREDYILYAILDFVVDNYMQVVDAIQAEVDALEERILHGDLNKTDRGRLYRLRRDLPRLRYAAVSRYLEPRPPPGSGRAACRPRPRCQCRR
jgi:magnesium transporter